MKRALRCTKCRTVLGYLSNGMLLRPKLCETDATICLDWDRITEAKTLHCPECGKTRQFDPRYMHPLDERRTPVLL